MSQRPAVREALPVDDDAEGLAAVTVRLRAAGCVFAEEEAALLVGEAADRSGRSRSEAHDATDPNARGRAAVLEQMVGRRVGGEPLEQVLGWVGFAGRRWAVAPGVFVPRQRSELLVEEAVRAAALPDRGHGPAGTVTVVDLCCGNGALGGAVTLALRGLGADVVLHASDVDPAATACATANLGPVGGAVHTGDLYAALPPDLQGTVDVLICHAPYVPTAAIALLPPEACEHEPLVALDGGPDGLDLLRRVITEAPRWLSPTGALLFELGDDTQLAEAHRLLTAADLTATVVEDDESATIIVMASPGGPVPTMRVPRDRAVS